MSIGAIGAAAAQPVPIASAQPAKAATPESGSKLTTVTTRPAPKPGEPGSLLDVYA